MVFPNMCQVMLVLHWGYDFYTGAVNSHADLFAVHSSARSVGEL